MPRLSKSTSVLSLALVFAGCSPAPAEDGNASAEQAATIRTTHVFQCETTCPLLGDVHTFSLEIASFDDPTKVGLNWSMDDWENDENVPMVTVPNDRLLGLIENAIVSKDKRRFEVHGDSDGIEYTDLVLYENSGY